MKANTEEGRTPYDLVSKVVDAGFTGRMELFVKNPDLYAAAVLRYGPANRFVDILSDSPVGHELLIRLHAPVKGQQR